MHRRPAPLLAATVLPVVVVAALLGGCSPTGSGGDGTGGGTSATPVTRSTDPTDADPTDAAAGDGTAATGTDAPATGTDASTTPTSDPTAGSGGQSGGDGSEVAPPAKASATGLGDLLADVPAAGRLTHAPRSGNATDRLVVGFPDGVVLVPEDATVRSSSVTREKRRVQAALAAGVPRPCADVLLAYRSWFTSGGFAEAPRRGEAAGTLARFTRGTGSSAESVTVAADARGAKGGRCAVELHAALVVPAGAAR
ncbi:MULTISPECIES: hypothetical protein [unclassified Isoptericola]|uniref:hypothetical protein n=1 Tax=unclassified Isoptericola TaxID=2623355 RepID=UPI00366477F8